MRVRQCIGVRLVLTGELRRLALVAALILTVLTARPAFAQHLRVAAASDLTFAFQDLAAAYRTQAGVTIETTFASSGTLFAQIENGAPFDVYFSADLEYPRRLEQSGRAERGSLRTYAIGALVLWATHESGLDVAGGLAALDNPTVRRIAIANPRTAPYGRAAMATLREAGVLERLQAKIVTGDSVAQAAQFVASGNAQVGFIGEALARSPNLAATGRFWRVPADRHPGLEQGAVIVARSSQKAGARRFLDYVLSPAGQAVLAKAGFTSPPVAGAARR